MPYKDPEMRRSKARVYAANYRARLAEIKQTQPIELRVCGLCGTDISHKKKNAKFCCRKHKTTFSDAKRDYAALYAKNSEKRRYQALQYYYADIKKSRKNLLLRQKKNLAIFAANQAKRRVAKLKRTPNWLTDKDLWLIDEVYSLAALRTKLTGAKWHVDHIVPLQGKTVSGLHVPQNLQVILARDNIAKHNLFGDA